MSLHPGISFNLFSPLHRRFWSCFTRCACDVAQRSDVMPATLPNTITFGGMHQSLVAAPLLNPTPQRVPVAPFGDLAAILSLVGILCRPLARLMPQIGKCRENGGKHLFRRIMRRRVARRDSGSGCNRQARGISVLARICQTPTAVAEKLVQYSSSNAGSGKT